MHTPIKIEQVKYPCYVSFRSPDSDRVHTRDGAILDASGFSVYCNDDIPSGLDGYYDILGDIFYVHDCFSEPSLSYEDRMLWGLGYNGTNWFLDKLFRRIKTLSLPHRWKIGSEAELRKLAKHFILNTSWRQMLVIDLDHRYENKPDMINTFNILQIRTNRNRSEVTFL